MVIKSKNTSSFLFNTILILVIGLIMGMYLQKYLNKNVQPSNKIPIRTVVNIIPSTPLELLKQQKENDVLFDQAIALSPGIDTPVNLSANGEATFYGFFVDTPGKVRFTTSNIPNEYQLTVYNPRREIVSASSRIGFLDSASTIAVQDKGKYYIKIFGRSNETNNATFTIRFAILPFFE